MVAPATAMHKKFIRMTSGWIPVSVMALLTVALIAGHARANLPKEVVAAQILTSDDQPGRSIER